MSTDLRNVPNLDSKLLMLTQTRFWGGQDRNQCLQVTQRKARGFQQPTTSDGFFNHIDLTREQARELAVELMLFAEGREVEVEVMEDCGDMGFEPGARWVANESMLFAEGREVEEV